MGAAPTGNNRVFVIDGDSEKLCQTIAGIRPHDAMLAEELTRLTDDFEFDTMLDVIQGLLKD